MYEAFSRFWRPDSTAVIEKKVVDRKRYNEQALLPREM
jgi:hypothetical protein